jgi:predicted amidophosphoribosyltransferase
MTCKNCKGQLEIIRACRKICMQCKECGQEFKIHEVADQLDSETEEILKRYTVIIYD